MPWPFLALLGIGGGGGVAAGAAAAGATKAAGMSAALGKAALGGTTAAPAMGLSNALGASAMSSSGAGALAKLGAFMGSEQGKRLMSLGQRLGGGGGMDPYGQPGPPLVRGGLGDFQPFEFDRRRYQMRRPINFG